MSTADILARLDAITAGTSNETMYDLPWTLGAIRAAHARNLAEHLEHEGFFAKARRILAKWEAVGDPRVDEGREAIAYYDKGIADYRELIARMDAMIAKHGEAQPAHFTRPN